MSGITISDNASSVTGEIARQVARTLGYEFVGSDVLRSAAEEFNIPENKLHQAVCEAPGFFGMSAQTRQRCIACFEAALTNHLLRDNIVYHGPAGSLAVRGISHFLKVRIDVPIELAIDLAAEREGTSHTEAQKQIRKESRDREKALKQAFGIDEGDPELYDLMIEFDGSGIDEIVKRISATIRDKRYQPMTYSLQCMKNKELTCRVRALLIDVDPDIRVRVENGAVFVDTKASGRSKSKSVALIRERVEGLPDVGQVEVRVADGLFERSAGLMR